MFETEQIGVFELKVLLERQESHYLDFKAKEMSGKDLQRHIVGLANADGGELYVGIREQDTKMESDGLKNEEEANHLV